MTAPRRTLDYASPIIRRPNPRLIWAAVVAFGILWTVFVGIICFAVWYFHRA
jgi:hypothetical protein